jgi:hypothetical protein
MRMAGLLLPWLLAGLSCTAWVLQSDHRSVVQDLALLGCLGGLWMAYRLEQRPEEGQLDWDGQSWVWAARGQRRLGEVRARLDWQQGLLLEFLAQDGPGAWLWLERRRAPLRWDELRRAVHAPAARVSTPSAAAGQGAAW